MKTAIVKTEIWKDKKIRKMHLDTKLLYLCLITNPDRNTTRFLKIDDDYISLMSGIDTRQLDLCKAQLQELELIHFLEDWAIFSDESYVMPAKGKLTSVIYEKDMAEVPLNVKELCDKLLLSRSCATPEYIYKDKYKDNSNRNSLSFYKTPQELGLCR